MIQVASVWDPGEQLLVAVDSAGLERPPVWVGLWQFCVLEKGRVALPAVITETFKSLLEIVFAVQVIFLVFLGSKSYLNMRVSYFVQKLLHQLCGTLGSCFGQVEGEWDFLHLQSKLGQLLPSKFCRNMFWKQPFIAYKGHCFSQFSLVTHRTRFANNHSPMVWEGVAPSGQIGQVYNNWFCFLLVLEM